MCFREFLDERLPPGSYQPSLGTPGTFDPAFSCDLGARGFVGVAISKTYGGGGRSAVDRLVATKLVGVEQRTMPSMRKPPICPSVARGRILDLVRAGGIRFSARSPVAPCWTWRSRRRSTIAQCGLCGMRPGPVEQEKDI